LNASVVISVFGLFHPTEFVVQPALDPIAVECGSAVYRLEGSQQRTIRNGCQISKRSRFILSLPHKIRREFEGFLRIENNQALVEMDLETAVASVVASEMPFDAPLEALQAQAIAARSYYLASSSHAKGRFCDSTHCQHIKGTIAAGHPASKAAQATRGMALEYEGRVLKAMYSGSCQGLRQAGAMDGYPYFAVECAYCRRRPSVNKALHFRGMCQAGAIDLAKMGKDARAILAHYYPGTRVR
jgi:peptidoglycan hydrolase-like amidase